MVNWIARTTVALRQAGDTRHSRDTPNGPKLKRKGWLSPGANACERSFDLAPVIIRSGWGFLFGGPGSLPSHRGLCAKARKLERKALATENQAGATSFVPATILTGRFDIR
jgi:hypothetical protein